MGDTTTTAWQFGDTTIKRVTELVAPTPSGDVLADVEAHHGPEVLNLSIHSYLLRRDGGWVVIDTCVGNCRTIPGIPAMTLDTPYLDRLRDAGIEASDVESVINTHLHFDHIGWNTKLVDEDWIPTFPNAKYYVAASELAFWQTVGDEGGPLNASIHDAIGPLEQRGVLEKVHGDDPLPSGLQMLATPGHTPGHFSVLCPTASNDRLVITGDVLHNAWQFEAPTVKALVDCDPEQAIATRIDFAQRCADERLVVFGTHFDDAPAGVVQRAGADSYRFQPLPGDISPS
jgi:glyoxylase-like metal-dependent hydrolase (beta-lactamase superfamily II)